MSPALRIRARQLPQAGAVLSAVGRLPEKYRYPCISIDLLKMGRIRSGSTTLTPEDDDELTAYLWPILRET